MSSNLDHALDYARRGWPAFLLHTARNGRCSCGRDCGRDQGKHPIAQLAPNGFKDATIDVPTICSWFDRWPDANIGIATGAASGLVVLDVDPRHGGDDSLEELETRYGRLRDTPVSLTGGGGTHSLFAHPGEHVPNRTGLGGYAGLDLKGDGGYIVAPPSIHASGRSYAWNAMFHPADVPLAACPEALLELAAAKRDAPRALYAAASWDGTIPPRVRALLRSDARLRNRFRRSTDRLRDTSPSGVDFALASILAFRRMTGAEIEASIRASRAQANLPERPPSYYLATVGKALGAAAHAA